jgi:hypothetical protein
MNKKKIFEKVTSIASLGVIGSTIGIAATSCGGSKPIPTPIYDYVGNDTGTDWKGYVKDSGKISIEVIPDSSNENIKTCRIISNWENPNH